MFFLFYAVFLAIKITVTLCRALLALIPWLAFALVCVCTKQRAPRLHRFIDPI